MEEGIDELFFIKLCQLFLAPVSSGYSERYNVDVNIP